MLTNKNRINSSKITDAKSLNEIKSTNINVLLNRVRLDKKKESRKKLIFTAATSLGAVIFGILIF